MSWEDVDEDAPSLADEEGREQWIAYLLEQNEPDDWVQCQVIHDGENMVARFRWSDGTEEIFDARLRRTIKVVQPAGPEGSN